MRNLVKEKPFAQNYLAVAVYQKIMNIFIKNTSTTFSFIKNFYVAGGNPVKTWFIITAAITKNGYRGS